jgi:hypothetical protein
MVVLELLHLNTKGMVWDLAESGIYLWGVLICRKEEAEVVLVVVNVVKDISSMVMLLCDMDWSRVYGTHATRLSMGPRVIFSVDFDILGGDVVALLIHDGEGDVSPSNIKFIAIRGRGDGSRLLRLSCISKWWFMKCLMDEPVGDEGFTIAVFSLNLPGFIGAFIITDNLSLGPPLSAPSLDI